MAEVEELFAEPAELTEETTESLGQLVCTWETIEDPESTDDFAFKLLIVQFFSGTPIPASSFFDPSYSESVVTIPGIGDLAYSSEDLGTSFNFVDEPVGGSLSYSEVDLGDTDRAEAPFTRRHRATVPDVPRAGHLTVDEPANR